MRSKRRRIVGKFFEQEKKYALPRLVNRQSDRINSANFRPRKTLYLFCTAPVKSGKITEIPDVYEKLLEHEKNGDLIIERYETLSENRLNQIRNMVKSEIEKYNLKSEDNSYSRFIKSRFTDL